MINYCLQNGCHNCKNVFELHEYEQPVTMYCTLNQPTRPLSGSLYLDECGSTYNEHCIIQDEFDKWAEGRLVEAYGICDAHIKKSENE